MKLFLISNMYPSKHHPSYGIFVKNFEGNLIKQGVEIPVKSVVKGRGKNILTKALKQLNLYISIIYKGLLADYDAIYVHFVTHPAIPILILRIIKKRKLIINVHGSDVFHLNKFVHFLSIFAIKLMRQSDLIITPSVYFKNVLIDKYNLPDNLIFPSPSGGIDTEVFKPEKKGKKSIFTIGYISRIDKDKGWDILLLAINELISNEKKNIKVIIVGDGAERLIFEEMISNLNLTQYIEYKGALPQKQLPNIISKMDIFVFPTKMKESLGLVGLEAMACGVPVIGSEIGGLKDYIIDNYNGMFFKTGDFKQLSNKILEFYNIAEQKKRLMSENAIKTAKKFEKNLITKQLVEKLYSLI